ncbi:MAG: type II secretion system protein [Verrucomicrobia bacterium]|nr:type II secretion system protein [Verrucomicrobiota bacterium]MBV9672378.1 type II secretion system protein [Verrucomicrobiota bacterium]
MKTKHRNQQRGFGLIQVLLSIMLGALTVTWASTTIINGIEKGIATKTLTAVEAIQQAKQQYLVDNPETDPTTPATFAILQPYLQVMGTPVTTEAELMSGSGNRTVTNYGTLSSGVSLSKAINPTYVTPSMKPVVQLINNGLEASANGGG